MARLKQQAGARMELVQQQEPILGAQCILE